MTLACTSRTYHITRRRHSSPLNLVAADVRRLHLFREISQSLLTSAATVQGFKARTSFGILTFNPSPLREREVLPPQLPSQAPFKICSHPFE
jgi:hypothetical protein